MDLFQYSPWHDFSPAKCCNIECEFANFLQVDSQTAALAQCHLSQLEKTTFQLLHEAETAHVGASVRPVQQSDDNCKSSRSPHDSAHSTDSVHRLTSILQLHAAVHHQLEICQGLNPSLKIKQQNNSSDADQESGIRYSQTLARVAALLVKTGTFILIYPHYHLIDCVQ